MACSPFRETLSLRGKTFNLSIDELITKPVSEPYVRRKGELCVKRRTWRFYVSVMPMQAGHDSLDKECLDKHNHLMTVIDDYLITVEPSKRKELERIRALAKQTVPGAEEAIVYGMPTLKYQGKPFWSSPVFVESQKPSTTQGIFCQEG
jgi:hypothetical protein